MTVKSPCILVCQLDWSTGWCFGCGRTADEIQQWLKFSEAERDDVLAALPDRLVKLGMPPTGDRIQAEDKAREQRGVKRRQNKRRGNRR